VAWFDRTSGYLQDQLRRKVAGAAIIATQPSPNALAKLANQPPGRGHRMLHSFAAPAKELTAKDLTAKTWRRKSFIRGLYLVPRWCLRALPLKSERFS
jgi:hypothetical protein